MIKTKLKIPMPKVKEPKKFSDSEKINIIKRFISEEYDEIHSVDKELNEYSYDKCCRSKIERIYENIIKIINE